MNPTPTHRPASFDNRVMAYRPGLSRLAYKFGYRGEERVDLVTDTLLYCLEHWQNFHGDTDKMWNWLYWQMRGKVSSQRNKKAVHLVYSDECAALHHTMDPPQHRQIELSETLRHMTGRDDAVLLRRAMGDGLDAISVDMGISKERVRQLEERARARLVGMREVA